MTDQPIELTPRAANAYQVLAGRGDRLRNLLDANTSLAQVLLGLTRGLISMADRRGWAPTRTVFSTPHLDGRGVFEIRFTPHRGGADFYRSWTATDVVDFRSSVNASLVDFVSGCRSLRNAIDQIYDKAYSFGFERRVPFSSLLFQTSRISANGRKAWLRVFTKEMEKAKADAGLA